MSINDSEVDLTKIGHWLAMTVNSYGFIDCVRIKRKDGYSWMPRIILNVQSYELAEILALTWKVSITERYFKNGTIKYKIVKCGSDCYKILEQILPHSNPEKTKTIKTIMKRCHKSYLKSKQDKA
jgi:hypothetical protein